MKARKPNNKTRFLHHGKAPDVVRLRWGPKAMLEDDAGESDASGASALRQRALLLCVEEQREDECGQRSRAMDETFGQSWEQPYR